MCKFVRLPSFVSVMADRRQHNKGSRANAAIKMELSKQKHAQRTGSGAKAAIGASLAKTELSKPEHAKAKGSDAKAGIAAPPKSRELGTPTFIKPEKDESRHFTIAQTAKGKFLGAYEIFGNDSETVPNGFLVSRFNHGVPHGSATSTDHAAIPILPLGVKGKAWEEADLVKFVRRMLEEHGMFVAAVGTERDADEFLSLLAADLEALLPNGLAGGMPNARHIGFVRGQCLPHGRAAAFVKSHPGIVAFMRLVCKAFGKLDPWDPAVGGAPCTSLDAVLMSEPDHCKGVQIHVDSNEFEPGPRVKRFTRASG